MAHTGITLPKNSFIVWLVGHRKLLTKDILSHWNIVVEDEHCLLCGTERETIDHIFFKCCYSRDMCKLVEELLQVRHIPTRFSEWVHWLEHVATKGAES